MSENKTTDGVLPCLRAPVSGSARGWVLRVAAGMVLAAVLGLYAVAAEDDTLPAAIDDKATAEQDAALRKRLDKTAELARQTIARKPEIVRDHKDMYALLLLKLEKADRLLREYWPGDFRNRQVEQDLGAADALLKCLSEGGQPPLQKNGRLERAYLAANDQSAQPYLLYVPQAYDGTRPFGLLVYLHGYAPDLHKENWMHYMYADVLDRYAEEADYIMLMPFARSNTDFQGIGEDDVVLATQKVLKDYRIDPDKVVMCGYSMGGMGAWTIGGHYPQMFAGLCALSGRGDFYQWKGFAPETIPPFKRKLAEIEFGANMLPNYTHLPVFMMHGSADLTIPTEQSRTMNDRLRALGFRVEYVELEGQGHFFFYTEAGYREEMLRWLKGCKRTGPPRKVAYRTYTLKFNRAYWAELLGIDDWGKAAELTAELNAEGTELEVRTENVLALRLTPPKGLVPDAGKLRVTWNGKPAAVRVEEQGVLDLGALEQGKGKLLKTPSLCGPVREAYAEPFAMVFGGNEDGESARHAMEAAVDWIRFAKGVPKLLKADQVDEKVMQQYNLFLFGPPEANPVMQKVMAQLPVKIQDGAIRVGDKSYDANKHGLWVVYPNPLAPGRCVVLCSGVHWGRDLPPNHKYDMLPDFIVFTEEKSEDGTESNKAVCAGFFDQYWQLDERSTWRSETPK